ncbi:hypothetical protein NFJ02_37g93890 [Pycnococcus provasolii]
MASLQWDAHERPVLLRPKPPPNTCHNVSPPAIKVGVQQKRKKKMSDGAAASLPPSIRCAANDAFALDRAIRSAPSTSILSMATRRAPDAIHDFLSQARTRGLQLAVRRGAVTSNALTV